MIINLESLFNGGIDEISLDYVFDFSDEKLSGTYPFEKPVRLSGKIVNRAGITTVEAVAYVSYIADCDRCASRAERVYEIPVEHTLVTELSNDSDADDFDYIIAEGMKLDIKELTLEDICLFLPSKFLCREDCKGVCPQCGTNLNESSCDCKKPVDPRFEALLSMWNE